MFVKHLSDSTQKFTSNNSTDYNLPFIAGALQQAIEVLKHSRKKASQAIFISPLVEIL